MTDQEKIDLDRSIELDIEKLIVDRVIDKQRPILISIDSGIVVVYGAGLTKKRMSLPLNEEFSNYIQMELCRQLKSKGYNVDINESYKSSN